MGACSQITVFTFGVMRRTPAADILEHIIPLLYLPVFTIWVSATKQASHTLKLFSVWVSATKQASHTLKLFSVWVSAIKQASHTHKLFSVRVSAIKQASHTHKLFSVRVSATKQASHTLKLFSVWVSATKQASHTHKLFTLRRKKGTEKLDPVSCAHSVAEGFQQKRTAPSGVDAAETVRFSWKVVEAQGQREHDVRISR